MTIALVLIVILAVVVAIAAVIAVIALLSGGKKNSEIHYSGGADIDSGRLSSDNNYFKGFSGTLNETTVVGGKRAPSGFPVTIQNLADNTSRRMTLSGELIIGRAGHYVVYDKAASRQHCKLFVSNGVLCVCDLNSANHTFLNGNCLTQAAALNSGDVIRVGKTELAITYGNL